MTTTLVRSSAVALIAAILIPVGAFAQQAPAGRAAPGLPTGYGAGAPVCSQLEQNLDISTDECGVYSLSDLARLKMDQQDDS